MSDLPLNALRTFAAVYETGGVRPASRALNVAHSSVSRHLRELEKALDIDCRFFAGSRDSAIFLEGKPSKLCEQS